MLINTFRYTPEDVACPLCTEYIAEVGCVSAPCPWFAERVEAVAYNIRKPFIMLLISTVNYMTDSERSAGSIRIPYGKVPNISDGWKTGKSCRDTPDAEIRQSAMRQCIYLPLMKGWTYGLPRVFLNKAFNSPVQGCAGSPYIAIPCILPRSVFTQTPAKFSIMISKIRRL